MHQLRQTLENLNLRNNWVVFAGRLNPGADVNTYRDLAKTVRDRGAKIAIDGSGAEFRAALEVHPELIKPNQFELAELVGRPLKTIHDVIAAAREVIDGGVEQVLCSLGKDGAILVTKDQVIHCEPEKAAVGTPVGAGDILLAIYLGGGAQPNALKDAIAWSAASVPLPGTAIPTPAQAAAVGVKVNEVLKDSRELAEVH
jgi:1-phosphofructokinase/6-phosphofructokinase 2